MRKRRLAIIAAGAVAVALAWFAPPERSDLALPAKGVAAGSPVASESPRLAALPARDALGEARDLFGPQSWTPPPVAPAKAGPPPAPVAPPNPYKVAGTIVQGGAKRVYLVGGDRVYEARQGDDLDGGYRVDTIAADQVVLLYVPLGKKESLPIAMTLGVDVELAPAPAVTAPPVASGPGPRISEDPSKPVQLRWEGPQNVRAGSSFTLALRVTSWQALRATPMQFTYEPKLLEPVGVRAGKFFGAGKFSYRVNPDGSIFVGATGEGAAPGADAELVVVTFRPIKAGTAEVRLSSLALQGAEGRALAHTQVAAFRTAIQ